MSAVLLRETTDADLPLLFEFQRDPDANAMAGFPARGWEAFVAHQQRIRADTILITRTIVVNGVPVGSIGSFPEGERRLVGYWIGQAYWGRGIATAALQTLLALDSTRPLHAYVVQHNVASRRVLEKCGFRVVGEERWFDEQLQAEIAEFLLELPGEPNANGTDGAPAAGECCSRVEATDSATTEE